MQKKLNCFGNQYKTNAKQIRRDKTSISVVASLLSAFDMTCFESYHAKLIYSIFAKEISVWSNRRLSDWMDLEMSITAVICLNEHCTKFAPADSAFWMKIITRSVSWSVLDNYFKQKWNLICRALRAHHTSEHSRGTITGFNNFNFRWISPLKVTRGIHKNEAVTLLSMFK